MTKRSDKARMDWIQRRLRKDFRERLLSNICSVTKDHHCRCYGWTVRQSVDAAMDAAKKGLQSRKTKAGRK